MLGFRDTPILRELFGSLGMLWGQLTDQGAAGAGEASISFDAGAITSVQNPRRGALTLKGFG